MEKKITERGLVEDARDAILERRDEQWKKLLRAKLAAIRDQAMELSAMLEFVHGGDALGDDVWQFGTRTISHAERFMANSRGELDFPESTLAERRELLGHCNQAGHPGGPHPPRVDCHNWNSEESRHG